MRALHNVVTTSWMRSFVDREDLETLLEQHKAIARAIADRSDVEAARAMEEHLRWARRLDRVSGRGELVQASS